ncbi:MAG: histidine phosphotransferase family protein [Alphaproteobacteria bacterium]
MTGPIGAVNNGAEFLGDEGFDMQHEAVQLILSSAHEAVNRLQFYRQAYGRVSDSGEACLADKKQLAINFFEGSKVKLDWPDTHTDAAGISISQKTARLILNMFVIAAAAMIRGGTISVRIGTNAAGDKIVTLSGKGETIKLDPETALILKGQGDDSMLSPKSAQPFLTRKIAEEVGATLAVEAHSDLFEIVATQHQLAVAAAS